MLRRRSVRAASAVNLLAVNHSLSGRIAVEHSAPDQRFLSITNFNSGSRTAIRRSGCSIRRRRIAQPDSGIGIRRSSITQPDSGNRIRRLRIAQPDSSNRIRRLRIALRRLRIALRESSSRIRRSSIRLRGLSFAILQSNLRHPKRSSRRCASRLLNILPEFGDFNAVIRFG